MTVLGLGPISLRNHPAEDEDRDQRGGDFEECELSPMGIVKQHRTMFSEKRPTKEGRIALAEDRREIPGTPEWTLASEYLSDAFSLAAKAHGSQRRPSDGRLFLEHVSEVAGLLRRLEFDEPE